MISRYSNLGVGHNVALTAGVMTLQMYGGNIKMFHSLTAVFPS